MAGRDLNQAPQAEQTQFPRFGISSGRKFAITNQIPEESQLLEILQNYSTEGIGNFIDSIIKKRGEEAFQSDDLFGLIVGASSKNRAHLTDCLNYLIKIINEEKTDISGENAELIESIGNMIKRLILECESRRFFNGPQINILLKSFVASISDLKDRYPVFLEIENACIERDIYSERFKITDPNYKKIFIQFFLLIYKLDQLFL